MQSMLPPEELRQEFSKRRFRQFLLVIPALAATIALRTLPKGGGPAWFGLHSEVVVVIGLAVLIGAVAYTFFNWRCPACNAYLGRSINPRACRKCTFAFRD